MRTDKLYTLLVWAGLFISCSTEKTLPILGETSIDPVSGKTIAYKAPQFFLTNQMNAKSSSSDFVGKIQVVDFFFTTCPTICPKMTNHLKLVEQAFTDNDRVAIISYTIDSANDTPTKLHQYADTHGIDHDKWTFLTGDAKAIFELSKDYKVKAFDDSSTLGNNLIHDGTFVLVDGHRRIRGYYNGLDELDTMALIEDIKLLLKE